MFSNVCRSYFLIKRASWKVTKVSSHFIFQQEPFKNDYILGNQKAIQEAAAREHDVQTRFWKL